MLKTVELTVDNGPLHNSPVSAMESFRFLGSTVSQDLKWETYLDSIVEEGQQMMYFLCQLRKFHLLQELLIQYYSAIAEFCALQ